MIVLLQADADRAAVEALLGRVRDLGLEAAMLDCNKGRAIEILGENRGRALALRGAPGVAEILTRRAALSGGEPLWPHFALRTGVRLLLLLAALVLLAAFFPPGLGDAAHPDNPLAGHAVEWYLRPAAGLVALAPEGDSWLAGLLGLALWVVFFAWPFLDGKAVRAPAARTLLRVLGVLVVAALVALGVMS